MADDHEDNHQDLDEDACSQSRRKSRNTGFHPSYITKDTLREDDHEDAHGDADSRSTRKSRDTITSRDVKAYAGGIKGTHQMSAGAMIVYTMIGNTQV